MDGELNRATTAGERALHDALRGVSAIRRLSFVVDAGVFGGAEAYVATVIAGLRDRFSSTVICVGECAPTFGEAVSVAGASLLKVSRPRGKLDAAKMVRLRRVLSASRPELVHVNLASAVNNRHALAMASTLSIPVVATLHIRNDLNSGLQRWILRRTFAGVDRAIAVSPDVARQLQDELGVSPDKVVMVANGVAIRRPLFLADDSPVRIGVLGRLTKQKGIDVLVEAVRSLHQRGVAVEAVIGGVGPEEDRLSAQAQGLPISFAGFLDDTEGFLDDMDIFCLPSRAEGLPFALLEAMMAGLPVVATDTGDVTEAVGDAGVVVPPMRPDLLAEALADLVCHLDQRRVLGARAHERAASLFSSDVMVAATAMVYESVLAP